LNNFKGGDKIITSKINDDNLEIKKGIVYIINNSFGDWIAIDINNLRYIYKYDKIEFKLLAEFRKEKIDKILNKIKQ
jgi:hypothetical protein